MNAFKDKKRWATMATVLSSVLIVVGCATTFKYTFDPNTRFAEQKSYAWTPSTSLSQAGHILETNVQVLADQLLAQKGFKRMSEKADLEIMMSFVSSNYGNKETYEIQDLTFSIYKTEKKELVWRGTAVGTINIDAASGDLKHAVQGILSNFPPKEK